MSGKSLMAQDVADAVELGFLEALRRRCPDYVSLLIPLGDLYTQLGRFEEGLDVDLRLVSLCPEDEMVWYNLACSFSLTHSLEKAVEALDRSVSLGYADLAHLREDGDLDNLREDPAFLRLIETLEERVGE